MCSDAQVGDSLEEFLVEATPDPKLRQVLMSLSEAVRTIAFKVQTPGPPIPICRKMPTFFSWSLHFFAPVYV